MGNVAVRAINTSHAIELGVCRAPGYGRRPLLDVLSVDVLDFVTIFIEQASSPKCCYSLLRRQVANKVRAQYTARVYGKCADSMRLPATIQLNSKQRVGSLRLAVGQHLVVGTTLKIRVVKVDGAEAVATGRSIDDPSSTGFLQCGQELSSKLEVSEVICRKLRLVTTRVTGQRIRCDARIVHEDVKRTIAGNETASKRSN